MCVKIAAMERVRALPGGFAVGVAVQAAGSRCSISIWFMRSLAAKIWIAARPSECAPWVDAWSQVAALTYDTSGRRPSSEHSRKHPRESCGSLGEWRDH